MSQPCTGRASGSVPDFLSTNALLVVQVSPVSAQEYVPGSFLRAFAASLGTDIIAQTAQLAPGSGALSPLAEQPTLDDGRDPNGSHSRNVPHKQHDVLLRSQAAARAAPAAAAAAVAAEVPSAATGNASDKENGVPANGSQLLYHSTRSSEEGGARSYVGSWTSSYCGSSMDTGSSWVTCLDPDCDGSHTSWDGSTSLDLSRIPRYTASANQGLASHHANSWRLPCYPENICYPMQQNGGK